MILVPLYGSIAIHAYGLALCIGIAVTYWRVTQHPWCIHYIGVDQFTDYLTNAIIFGIVGGKLMYWLTETDARNSWTDFIFFWQGGFASWGTIIALCLYIPWYAQRNNLSYALLLDLTALYAPLLHAIARVGCFLSGCCGGIRMHVPGTQTVWVHPTQLYSSLCFLVIFCILRYLVAPRQATFGAVFGGYLMLTGIERGLIDFWRNDRIMTESTSLLSVHQLFALASIALGGIYIAYRYALKTRNRTSPL